MVEHGLAGLRSRARFGLLTCGPELLERELCHRLGLAPGFEGDTYDGPELPVILGFKAGVKSVDTAVDTGAGDVETAQRRRHEELQQLGEVLTAPGFASMSPRDRYDAVQLLERVLRLMLADRTEMVTALHEVRVAQSTAQHGKLKYSTRGGYPFSFFFRGERRR